MEKHLWKSVSKQEKADAKHQRKHGKRNGEEAIPAFVIIDGAGITECLYGAGDIAKGQGNLKHNQCDFYKHPERPSMIEGGQQNAGDNHHFETRVGHFGFKFDVPLEQ